MDSITVYQNFIFLSIAIILSVAINWILIKFSLNLGIRNVSKEDEIRWQCKKPSIGGLSFYIVFLILFSLINVLSTSTQQINKNNELALLLSCTLGFIVGLIDDARNTNPLLKFLGQIFCGIILVYFGETINLSPSIIWNQIITILWVVFLMNSINMLDNMDGLTTTISILIIGGVIWYNVHHAITTMSILICILGALLGFLFYNWHPSRIYMGDSGSQFLGIFLAFISIHYIWNDRTIIGGYFQIHQFFMPLFVFTIPIYDTATVSIHRIWSGKSPFVGGRDHLSHHLVYLGFKDYEAVSILCIMQLLSIGISMIVMVYYPQWILGACIVWVLMFILVQLLYIRAKKFIPTQNSNEVLP